MKSYNQNSLLSYEYLESDIREASKITLEVPSDMNVYEFKIVCVRLAKAMGYGDESIKKAFGKLHQSNESERQFKQLLNNLNITGDETK